MERCSPLTSRCARAAFRWHINKWAGTRALPSRHLWSRPGHLREHRTPDTSVGACTPPRIHRLRNHSDETEHQQQLDWTIYRRQHNFNQVVSNGSSRPPTHLADLPQRRQLVRTSIGHYTPRNYEYNLVSGAHIHKTTHRTVRHGKRALSVKVTNYAQL